jgi:hypothetical protein
VESYDPGTLVYETTYYWQVVCRNTLGETSGNIWHFTTEIESGSDDPLLPAITELTGNYPNPFNPSTTIEFSLAVPSYVAVDILNIKGNIVNTLVKSDLNAGYYGFVWNGIDQIGNPLPSGVYFYRLKTNDFNQTKKMLLLK